MKVTKYEHACLDITEASTRIVIDPGTFSKSFTNYEGIDALIITHIHGDHFSEDTLEQIVARNHNVKIYTTAEVAKKIDNKAEIVQPNTAYKAGDLTLEFFGKNHAVIDPQTPVAQNIGVLVNNILYYPGDSFTECPKPFHVLAVPSSAPWMRVGEMIPMIENSQCKQVFPTHNIMLTEIGHEFSNNWLQKFAERSGKTFTYLRPSESIEV